MKPFLFRLLLAVYCLASLPNAHAADRVIRRSRPGYYQAETRIPNLADGPLRSLALSTCTQWARQSQHAFIQDCNEAFHALGKPQASYDYTSVGKITYRSPQLVSLLFDSSQYTGGAHPISYYRTFTFGVVKGRARALKLADFFTPGSDYQRRISDTVIAKLKQKEGATEVTSGNLKQLTAKQLEQFVVLPDGLEFLFDPYEVGPYAAGSFQIKLTVAELGPNFKKMLIFARTAPARSHP